MLLESPILNHILALLPAPDSSRLSTHLEFAPMQLGEVLHEPGEVETYAYFPSSCVVSLLSILQDGGSAEVALVGFDGMVGMSLLTGLSRSPHRAVIQAAGHAHRMKARYLREEFDRNESLRKILLRYSQALTVQISQVAVCNRHHTVDQQLCRWILMSIDRLAANELSMTQELIAQMLGVRREGVTQAAGKLQQTGAIRYHRGLIKVFDRAKLEALSCECYEVVKVECARLLPPIAPQHALATF